MMNPLLQECRRLVKAFGYSWAGLKAAFATEAAFRIEVASAIILIPLACWLDVTGVERALLIGSVLLVLMIELINTAIEAVVNRVSMELHPLSKKAKDVGSAIVLMSLVNAAAVWGTILLAL